jgi:hypothetical protein
LNRETSVYPDLVRFTAAVGFLFHVSGQRRTGGMLWQIAPHRSEAVTVFFVLSRSVIGYVTGRRETTAADAIGRLVNPAAYALSWGYHADGQLWQVPTGLLFGHRVWCAQISQGSDLPDAIWSARHGRAPGLALISLG